MDVAILGASGDCGREIAGQLIASRLLAPTERLQLVGRANGASAHSLHGLACDLTDAHAEHLPDLDVALDASEIVADIWVVACGGTIPANRETLPDRGKLAAQNGRLFADYAQALAKQGQGSELVIIVSNPVELGVALFADAIGRDRVIGIGAYQDTLRFRREIAADLGVRRQRVGAYMLGEHGDSQLPVWSSVQVHGMAVDELADAMRTVRKGVSLADFSELCRSERAKVTALLAQDKVAEAFTHVELLPPDLRVILKPYITHLSGSKTVMATANATVGLLQMLLSGHEALIAGQVLLKPGDFYGLSGVLGVPIIAGPGGISRVVEIPLSDLERARIAEISTEIGAKRTEWMAAI